jgi:hypothetical protein
MSDEPTQVTEQNLDEAANVRYLKPGDFVLYRTEAGSLRMTLENERTVLRVKAKRCFPFSSPVKYISIRDGNDDEIGIISDLAHLSREYRRWIEDDLEMRYFTPRVTGIKLIRHRFGGVEWHVETNCGPKRLITKGVHDTMTEVEIGRYVITDVDGNRYEVYTEELDAMSRERIERLI